MIECIQVLERKHIQALIRLGEKSKYPDKESKKCDADAEYYLDNNDYDFKAAITVYKADLEKELEEAK